jgi:hypothetical protein
MTAAVATQPRQAGAANGDATLDWLLASSEPAVRWLARTQVLGLDAEDGDTRRDRKAILEGPIVSALLEFENRAGRIRHPYTKWTGAHWRLVSLVELGIPKGEPRAVEQLDPVLRWLTNPGHLRGVPVINRRARRCGSQEGNALAVATRLGQTDDPRVHQIAENLVRWQWPDGGWNCDRKPSASHSSFHESISPMWGLLEYANATGHAGARKAAKKTTDFVLRHEVFRSERTGRPMHPSVVVPHWPPYWHYDFLRGLTILARADALPNRRANAALDELLAQRQPDGTWRAGRRWWTPPGRKGSGIEAVDWGEDETEDRLVTIAALSALTAAGRLQPVSRP